MFVNKEYVISSLESDGLPSMLVDPWTTVPGEQNTLELLSRGHPANAISSLESDGLHSVLVEPLITAQALDCGPGEQNRPMRAVRDD